MISYYFDFILLDMRLYYFDSILYKYEAKLF